MSKQADDTAKVVVVMKDNAPHYTFTGTWCVRDALSVGKTFSRSYRRYMKETRRKLQEVVNERSIKQS